MPFPAGTRPSWAVRDEEDERKVRAFERAIQRLSRQRFGDLVAQLESGPPANRAVVRGRARIQRPG